MQHENRQTARDAQSAHVLNADPKKAMQEMMDMIDHMRGVYENETAALERFDAKGFLAVQEEKLQATNAYRAGVEDILRRRSEMRGVDTDMKRKIERMQKDFSDLSVKNMSALKQMQKTMERLGETVQKVAKDAVNKQNAFSYGDSGRLNENERKRVSIGVSETA
ncbi:MAG: hypothetical protein JKY71_11960 [Alphaproteobacteria bacterium]|nr:hypothetical protein [Alphaproteobacteria bacterium]